MEVSKFKIGNNIIDVKDAQARDDVIAAMNAAQNAQSTADLKQDATDALKVEKVTKTFTNVTIAANGGGYNFNVPFPSDAITPVPVFARSTSANPITVTGMYASSSLGVFVVRLNNITTAPLSIDSITIEVTYLYK